VVLAVKLVDISIEHTDNKIGLNYKFYLKVLYYGASACVHKMILFIHNVQSQHKY